MIEIENLVKYYGDNKAVDNITFTVDEGEILGFLGPNGAGKSTTMNILTGYLSASSGRVRVNGYDILEEPMKAKKEIGYLPEQPPLYHDMTVTEYLKFICDLKGIERKVRASHMKEIMQVVQIDHVAGRLIRNLSKGYKQRVGIAQAMVGNPQVLVLDEPTVGLDPVQIIEIRRLIRKLRKNHTVILSSHILPEVQAVCDRIAIISYGKIVALGTPEDLAANAAGAGNYSLMFDGPVPQVVQRLNEIRGVEKVAVQKEGKVGMVAIQTDANVDIRRDVFRLMSGNNWPILEFRSKNPTLEEIFLSVTNPSGISEVNK